MFIVYLGLLSLVARLGVTLTHIHSSQYALVHLPCKTHCRKDGFLVKRAFLASSPCYRGKRDLLKGKRDLI